MAESYLTQPGPMQLEQDRLVIARVNGTMDPATCKFRAMNPDSRVRLKIAVAFTGDAGASGSILSMPTTLYLGEEEQMSARGTRVLCGDVLRDASGNVVHQSAPLTIPEDAGLQGFSIEFVTAADSILGIFSTESPGGFSGFWTVQARWQPDGQRLCNEDWDYVRRQCRLIMVGDPIAGGE